MKTTLIFLALVALVCLAEAAPGKANSLKARALFKRLETFKASHQKRTQGGGSGDGGDGSSEYDPSGDGPDDDECGPPEATDELQVTESILAYLDLGITCHDNFDFINDLAADPELEDDEFLLELPGMCEEILWTIEHYRNAPRCEKRAMRDGLAEMGKLPECFAITVVMALEFLKDEDPEQAVSIFDTSYEALSRCLGLFGTPEEEEQALAEGTNGADKKRQLPQLRSLLGKLKGLLNDAHKKK